MKIVLNKEPLSQRAGLAPITCFTGVISTTPIDNFYRATESATGTVKNVQCERSINGEQLVVKVAKILPVVQDVIKSNRQHPREKILRGFLSNFTDKDFFLAARDYITSGEKLSLLYLVMHFVVKYLNAYVYQVEDVRNGHIEDIHASRLKYYHDPSLHCPAIISHFQRPRTECQFNA